ncbi:hypothetical protein QVD17_30662 [Tagetes erecta]|uniref:Uncharacterized protein n=1 Tax=Tagetes erecta TaxID=13708 RepID=A0AAD8NG66_TARER|nr:hypothetical protein QVD17_30662 [Tagetes erecta]
MLQVFDFPVKRPPYPPEIKASSPTQIGTSAPIYLRRFMPDEQGCKQWWQAVITWVVGRRTGGYGVGRFGCGGGYFWSWVCAVMMVVSGVCCG